MIKAVKFVNIPVADQDRALAFNTEKLGFAVATDQAMGPRRWIELRIPGAEERELGDGSGVQGFGREPVRVIDEIGTVANPTHRNTKVASRRKHSI